MPLPCLLHKTSSRALLLGSLLISPLAGAWELLGLQPGVGHAEVAEVLSREFPAEAGLKAIRNPAAQHVNVQAFDATSCDKQSLCTAGYSEQAPGSQRIHYSRHVQAAFTRSGRLSGLRHQLEQEPAGQCAVSASQLKTRLISEHGQPSQQSSLRRGGVEYQLLQWGDCPGRQLCLDISIACNQQGLLETSTSLSDFSLRKQ